MYSIAHERGSCLRNLSEEHERGREGGLEFPLCGVRRNGAGGEDEGDGT